MKTIALLTLLTLGVVVVSGCHWHHHRSNYSDGLFPLALSALPLRALLHRVIRGAIIPENFFLVRVTDRELEKVVNRFGIF